MVSVAAAALCLALPIAGAAPSSATPLPAPAVCGSSSLEGPATAPAGAVTVPAGLDNGQYDTPDTTYWFAPGTHTLGTGTFSQIDFGQGD
ncbi:MAG TPA: hypothetical protein VEH29_08725, partial [Acidimicrobiales bacterium]|nr:hypothetical protein [Acidimicrobiales bacterium]